MALSIKLLQPAGSVATSVQGAPSGVNYQVDAAGFVTVNNWPDAQWFVLQGWMIRTDRVNVTATTDPGPTNDGTVGQDYFPGSVWINTVTGVNWRCVSSATGAAVWMPQNATNVLIGRLLGANMNVTTDQAIPLFLPATALFFPKRITVTNASISLTTAAGGIYDTATKGGTAIVAAAQAYSALTAATKTLDLTIAAATKEAAAAKLYFSLTTAQGAAATADIYVIGDLVTQ